MPTAFAEVSISFAGDSRLFFSDRFDDDPRFSYQLIKLPTGYGIAAGIDDSCSFYEAGRGYPVGRGLLD